MQVFNTSKISCPTKIQVSERASVVCIDPVRQKEQNGSLSNGTVGFTICLVHHYLRIVFLAQRQTGGQCIDHEADTEQGIQSGELLNQWLLLICNQLTLKCTTPAPLVLNASSDVTTP